MAHFRGPGSEDRRAALAAPLEAEPPKSLARYAKYRQLYEEAKAVHGVSQWQGAWRRLKKNYVAMASLAFICVLAVLAILTPALPLQSPMVQNVTEEWQYQPPGVSPRRLEIKDVDNQIRPLSELLARHRNELSTLAAANDENAYAAKLTAHPYLRFWNKPSPLTSKLIDLRLALFGD